MSVRGKDIKFGSRVAFSREYLRSIGKHTGQAPFDRGVVGKPTASGVIVEVFWNRGFTQDVNVGNLVLESNIHLELA